MQLTWAVDYRDGTSLSQFDATSSDFIADSGEVPYRAIDWQRVSKLRLESQDAVVSFDVVPPHAGSKISLRSRHFRTPSGLDTMCFMITESLADEEVTAETVKSVIYVFPDGTTHECPNFNCPDIGKYAHNKLRDQATSLMPATHEIQTEVTAVVE